MSFRTLPNLALRDGLSVLLQIASRESGADGYAILQNTEDATHKPVVGGGREISADTLSRRGSDHLLTFPLKHDDAEDGLAAFVFPQAPSTKALSVIARLKPVIQSVWQSARKLSTKAELLDRALTLEAELLDSKITDRARGLLVNQAETDSVEVIAKHVESVLRVASSQRVIEEMVAQFEEELHVRQVAAKAKEVLCSSRGMSEEEAHAHLRLMSRKSRKRVKDVALSVIRQHSGTSVQNC
jgi:hypothetical protein